MRVKDLWEPGKGRVHSARGRDKACLCGRHPAPVYMVSHVGVGVGVGVGKFVKEAGKSQATKQTTRAMGLGAWERCPLAGLTPWACGL